MLILQVKEKHIENLTPEEEFIRGTVGAECQIDLDEFWQGYENTVVFKRENDCTVYNVAIDSLSNRVEIPYTILAESGSFKVGLFGVKPDEVLPTLWSDYIKIRYGTDTHGTTPPKYEPNEIDQLRLSKQDKLTAGDGIAIDENNVISATGGSGTVDDVQINGESIVDEGVANIPIDQTYNANSLNAQSGKAVAEAVSNCVHKVKGNGHTYQVYAVGDLDNEYNECTLTVENNSYFASDINYGEIPRRQDNGNIMTNTPVIDLDCANKKYVDDKISAIPSDDGEVIMEYTTTADDENASIIGLDFANGNQYKKLFVIIDESGISGTTYMSVRFGVRVKNTNNDTIVNSLPNTQNAYKNNTKYKTFYAESITTNLYLYRVTSEVQLFGYTSSPSVGQYYNEIEDVSKYYGICWWGKIYEGTKITVYGVRV